MGWLATEGGPVAALKLEFRFRVADDLVFALRGDCVDDDPVVVGRLDRAGDSDLLLGGAHAAELDREAFERARVAVAVFACATTAIM
jgi:hypothetical protein